MSSTAKIIIAVVVVVLIGAGIWYYESGNGSWSTAGTSADSSALPSGSDTSDAALNEDMTSINANAQTVDSDSANVDQSVSDTDSANAQ